MSDFMTFTLFDTGYFFILLNILEILSWETVKLLGEVRFFWVFLAFKLWTRAVSSNSPHYWGWSLHTVTDILWIWDFPLWLLDTCPIVGLYGYWATFSLILLGGFLFGVWWFLCMHVLHVRLIFSTKYSGRVLWRSPWFSHCAALFFLVLVLWTPVILTS